jgi:hypothetical protein
MYSIVALISSARPGTVHPNSSATRSAGPIIVLSALSAAANDASGLATGLWSGWRAGNVAPVWPNMRQIPASSAWAGAE